MSKLFKKSVFILIFTFLGFSLFISGAQAGDLPSIRIEDTSLKTAEDVPELVAHE